MIRRVGAAGPADEMNEILRSDPKIGTARLNKRQLERLDHLVGQGYWLTSVDGYASPEGRRRGPDRSDRGAAAKWEGNERALQGARREGAEADRRALPADDEMRAVLRPRHALPAGQQIPRASAAPRTRSSTTASAASSKAPRSTAPSSSATTRSRRQV